MATVCKLGVTTHWGDDGVGMTVLYQEWENSDIEVVVAMDTATEIEEWRGEEGQGEYMAEYNSII